MLEERANPVHWTWLVYLEMFLAGVAGGAYVAAAMLELSGRGRSAAARAGHLIAFPLVLLATLLLIVDLSRPERFWHMVLMNERLLPILKPWSPISLGTWLLMLFAAVSFTLNYAAYEAEVLRGALLAVPKGELEAGRAFGMGRFTLIRRIWLPRAIRIALPTIAGEVVMQLKATPLAFTVTVMDLYAVAYKVRQDTLLVYEPLIVVTVFYLILTAIIARCFGLVERQVPVRR